MQTLLLLDSLICVMMKEMLMGMLWFPYKSEPVRVESTGTHWHLSPGPGAAASFGMWVVKSTDQQGCIFLTCF